MVWQRYAGPGPLRAPPLNNRSHSSPRNPLALQLLSQVTADGLVGPPPGSAGASGALHGLCPQGLSETEVEELHRAHGLKFSTFTIRPCSLLMGLQE